MSWFQKLLPQKSSAAKAMPRKMCLKDCGASARPVSVLYHSDWRKPERLPEVQAPSPHLRAYPSGPAADGEGRFEIGAEVLPIDTSSSKTAGNIRNV